jgi:hypothetical protein
LTPGQLLFGTPIAHEDRAVRACYAALAMQAPMRAPCIDRHVWRGQGLKIRGRLPFPEEQVTEEA